MPYDTLSDLPDSVRDTLPNHAQEIYQAAYNDAWDEYADPEDRRDPDDSARLDPEAVEYVCGRALWKREHTDRDPEGTHAAATVRRVLIECPDCEALNILPPAGGGDPS